MDSINWEQTRQSEFFVLGSKDESCGNQSCQASIQNDESLTLKLRLPNAFSNYGSHLFISQVKFAYGHQEILTALSLKQAVCYRFKWDEKGWRIFVTITTAQSTPITRTHYGTIGIDINQDHLAVSETDRFGNPIHKQTFQLNLFGKNTNQSKALIGDVCKNIIKLAERTKKPLVLEKLNFQKKKSTLRENGPSYARGLSSFAYNSIITHIKSRACKYRIEVKEVNPAYTSIIGRTKFAKRYGLSIHHAAALTIARRSEQFSEKLPSSLKEIPDGRGGHVALSLPERNRSKHVWTSWSKLVKKLPVALVAHFRAMKNRSLSTHKSAQEILNIPKVIGEIPIHESSEQLLC